MELFPFFEAVSELKSNLGKLKLMLVGAVDNIGGLAYVRGLLSIFMGMYSDK